MPSACPRCAGPVADSDTRCPRCARPLVLDVTARVPRHTPPVRGRPFARDAMLLLGGIGGIVAATTSDNWLIAAVIVIAGVVLSAVVHYL
jgi:hypothetical protein